MEETILNISDIHKSFDGTEVLKGIEFTAKKGEFITFLGPSGCGKTTMLRIIAGLEEPDCGSVYLGGSDVTALAPNKRNVNTVFQNYALFPHMNVAANIGYGLKVKGIGKDEIKRRVSQMLSLVQLSGFEKRMPSQLSGGQRQRVAIARAIINNPDILLLDEPLGALDLQLRRQMQTELKRLQKKLGITFIYITHDQEEAINMSDRIAVMRDGRLEQVGTPSEIYDYPKTSFVAEFVGMSNLFSGTVKSRTDETLCVEVEGVSIPVNAMGTEHQAVREENHTEVTLSVRRENLMLSDVPSEHAIPVTVEENSYAGGMLRIALKLPSGGEAVATRQGIQSQLSHGDRAYLSWNRADAVLVDREAVQ